jgi:transposase-like protein
MQSDLQAEFARLRRLAEQHTERGYPQEFRRRALALEAQLTEQGWTQQRLVDALGISRPTLRRWREKYGVLAESKTEKPQLRPVEMSPAVATQTTVRIVSPEGWRIEGLRLDEVAELMGRLR